ncbi:hypothetical protein HQ531_06435 [bacterium]|nr:hypothetical protein [bacterium]
MEPVYKGKEFEALKLRYEDQVEFLRSNSVFNFRVLSGFFAIQILIGGWILKYPAINMCYKIGLMIIDVAMGIISIIFLTNLFHRRKEAIDTVRNINEALGLTVKDAYLDCKPINAEIATSRWTWFISYIICILVSIIGFLVILFGSPMPASNSKSGAMEERMTKIESRLNDFELKQNKSDSLSEAKKK